MVAGSNPVKNHLPLSSYIKGGPLDLKGEFGVPPSPIRSGFQVRLTNRRDGQLASQLNREVPTQSPQNSPEWPFLGRRRLRKRSPGKTVAVC